MADTPYLLFHGGNYKRGIDDWRIRVPLNEKEIDEVFYDPDVPNDTDNSRTPASTVVSGLWPSTR